MRKAAILIFYSFFLLILGRNLLFIPTIQLGGQEAKKDPQDIRDQILDYLGERDGEFNIYYQDLVTEENLSIHSNTLVTAASINKLPIVAYLYHLASEDEIDLQETIVIQATDIQDYGTGSLRYQEPGQQYTLQTLAKLSLKESDNTAAHVLTIRLGEDNIQSYAYQLGMGSTSMASNDTTARDVARFFDALYKNVITDAPLTLELLEYMEDTDFEDRIPALLPESVHSYHKTGDEVGFIHDGGIVKDGDNAYILVVLSSNVGDKDEAKETISTISKMIYEGRGK